MESVEYSLSFQQYLLILKRRWLPATVVFLVVFAIAALYALRNKPIYQAEAKLAFKKISTTSSLTGLGKEVGEFTPIMQESNPLTTELEVIKSTAIVKQTINKLKLKDEKGTPLKTKQFLKRLNVAPVRGGDLLVVSYQDQDPERATAVVNTVISFYLENNQRVNKETATSARKFIEKQLPTAELSVRQAAEALESFKKHNKVVDLQEESKSAVQNISDLDRQAAQARSELADTNAQYRTLQNQLGMNSQQALTATALNQSPSVQQALRDYQQVERQLVIERTRFQETHPIIADLKIKKSTLQVLLQQQIQKVIRHQSKLAQGNLELGDVKPRLIEEFARLEAKRQGLISQISALSQLKANYQQWVNILPELEKQQRELENKLQAAQTTYSQLLQKFQEIRITENQNLGNARVIQAAVVPEEPMASRKSLFLASGFLLGSLAAITTTIFLEKTNKSLNKVDKANNLFEFTLLGVIPEWKQSQKIDSGSSFNIGLTTRRAELSIPQVIVKDSPSSPLSAAYRVLQANLMFLYTPQELKKIVVTSSVPKEGKSTICANLAMAAAQLGRRVLLIDGAMYHPFQHHIWRLPNQEGLSNVMIGEADLKAVLQSVNVNLEVLTSGVIPPDLMPLLDYRRMALLIEKFSSHYDLIIIDTPALNVATDALTLAKMADGIMLVVRPEVVDPASAAAAQAFLHKSGQHVFGQVLNK